MLNCVLFYFMSHNSGIGVRYTQSPYSLKKNPKTFDQMFYKIFKKRKRKRYANLLFNAEKLC
uniref:Uncharacterized protein n=1 Tax=Octopus bimaculoides TaxID=37653 RepID=A0A0L8I1T4_OCTBM